MASPLKIVLVLSSLSVSTYSQENDIHVSAHKKESTQNSDVGQSESITPSSNSRYDTNSHFKERSSFDTQNTGKPSSSGFIQPRTRGQDAKASSVYIDSQKLFDPATGFPLLEDLDLRAFGRLHIHRGVTPYDVTNTNPTGTIVFKTKTPGETKFFGSTTYGKPFGSRAVIVGEGKSDSISARLYSRFHESDGQYTYFENNGTPANTTDDSTKTRLDNFSRSWQLVPLVQVDKKHSKLRLLGVYGSGTRGVPTLGGRGRTHSKTKTDSQVSTLHYEYTGFESKALPSSVSFNSHYRAEFRETSDPFRKIFVTQDRKKFSTHGYSSSVKGKWSHSPLPLIAKIEHGQTDAKTSLNEGSGNFSLSRQFQEYYFALRSENLSLLQTELKYRIRQTRDSVKKSSSENSSISRKDKGSGVSIGFNYSFGFFYLQAGKDERPPSLIEEFGDGSMLIGNSNLRVESIEHFEIGNYATVLRDTTLNLSLFQDSSENKIVFVPSFSNAFRAVNLKETRVFGFESEIKTEVSSFLQLALGYSRLIAEDTSDKQNIYKIPRVPEHLGTVQIVNKSVVGTTRISMRYRGESYSDVQNNSKLPQSTIFNASIDKRFDLFSLSFMCDNLLDTKSIPYEVEGTGEKGERAYSELSGYPLPGRTWKATLSSEL